MTTIQERLRYKGVEDESIFFKAGIALSIVGEAADIIDQQQATITELVEALEKADLALNSMVDTAFKIGIMGTKDWDDIAGGADLFGVSDNLRVLITKHKQTT